jgi:aminoglycoside 3-N-acetyltransferase
VHEDLPENVFERIALDYLASGSGRQGTIGNADSYLFEGQDLVRFGIEWIERAIAGSTTGRN